MDYKITGGFGHLVKFFVVIALLFSLMEIGIFSYLTYFSEISDLEFSTGFANSEVGKDFKKSIFSMLGLLIPTILSIYYLFNIESILRKSK